MLGNVIRIMKMMEEQEKRIGLPAFRQDESGMGTVEIILIIVVLIALVIIFKTQLTSLVNTIFETMVDDAGTVLSD